MGPTKTKVLIALACVVLVGLVAWRLLGARRGVSAGDVPNTAAPVSADAVFQVRARELPEARTVSLTLFTQDTRLSSCADFTFSVTPLQTTDDSFRERVRKRFERFETDMTTTMKGWSRIQKRCEEQFRNPVLATCTMDTSDVGKGDSGIESRVDVHSVNHFYDLDSLTKNDADMKGCLDAKGDWQAADHDSDEYREAERSRLERQLAKTQQDMAKRHGAPGQ